MKAFASTWLAPFFVLLLALGSIAPTQADDATQIALSGAGIEAGTLSLDDLLKQPSIEQQVQFQTSKGEEKGTYKGALLWPILEARGIKNGGHNAQLLHSFAVEGRDGYRIVFSIGEIDPDFGNAPIAIAFERDGTAMVPGEGFRLIVPGDKRGARYVKDIVKIEVQ